MAQDQNTPDKKQEYNISGTISYNGEVYIPAKELVKFCQRFPHLWGKDFARIFETAKVSPNIKNIGG